MAKIDDQFEDELDLTEEGEEGEDDKEKEKPQQQQQSSSAGTDAAIKQLTLAVNQLVNNASTSKTVTEKQISGAERAIDQLLGRGYKPEDLEAVVTLVGGVKSDLEREYELKLKEVETKQVKQTLDSECHARAEAALNEVITKDCDEDTKHFLISKMYKIMNDVSNAEYESARHAYAQGRAPSAATFAKVASLVLRFAPSEFAKSKDGTRNGGSPGLDTGSSRPRPSSAIGKNGEVDVNKLDEFEKEIYYTTLNTTKNKALALEALKVLGPTQRK